MKSRRHEVSCAIPTVLFASQAAVSYLCLVFLLLQQEHSRKPDADAAGFNRCW